MPKKKINSVDQLAAFTAEEFNDVGKRIERLENVIHKGFQEMRGGFQALTDISNSLLHETRRIRISDIEKRVDRLEQKVGIGK